jgi:NAD(P)-dependent dehydrogenase (short-subunit alcohol dehydrogenase family)
VDAGGHAPGRKVAIVTAAGKGMGAACARELATRGYSLAMMSPPSGRFAPHPSHRSEQSLDYQAYYREPTTD